jgi:hypothetical protein
MIFARFGGDHKWLKVYSWKLSAFSYWYWILQENFIHVLSFTFGVLIFSLSQSDTSILLDLVPQYIEAHILATLL